MHYHIHFYQNHWYNFVSLIFNFLRLSENSFLFVFVIHSISSSFILLFPVLFLNVCYHQSQCPIILITNQSGRMRRSGSFTKLRASLKRSSAKLVQKLKGKGPEVDAGGRYDGVVICFVCCSKSCVSG